MVDIRLDTEDLDKLPGDHYLSLRVGEAQKLAKLSASRSYRFSAATAGSRKYGKIEVYRRVATSVLCIDPATALPSSTVEVDVGDVRLRFDASIAFTEARPAPPAEPRKAGHAAAAEYLQKHRLEARLSEVMSVVLRERPVDPLDFMAKQLLKGPRAAAPADLTAGFAAYFRQHFRHAAPARLYAGFRAPVPAQPDGGDGFGGYYRKHFLQTPRSHGERLYARRAAAPPRAGAGAVGAPTLRGHMVGEGQPLAAQSRGISGAHRGVAHRAA